MTKLFDIANGQLIPTEHCFTIRSLKRIMQNYPNNYMKIYTYLFYMTCPNPDLNPFFHYRDEEKEEAVLEEIEADFNPEDEDIIWAKERCERMYETETLRAYRGIKKVLDNMATYMENVSITDGRDGNITQIVSAAKNFNEIRQSFKGVMKDLMEEQSTTVRGGQNLAYDQM